MIYLCTKKHYSSMKTDYFYNSDMMLYLECLRGNNLFRHIGHIEYDTILAIDYVPEFEEKICDNISKPLLEDILLSKILDNL